MACACLCLAQGTQQLGTSACTRCFLLELFFPVKAATTCQHTAQEITFPELAPGLAKTPWEEHLAWRLKD